MAQDKNWTKSRQRGLLLVLTLTILNLGSRRPATGVKSRPGSKSQKGVSRKVSEVSRPTPEKESKTSLRSQEQVIFDSQSLLETRFLTLFGGLGRDPSETPRETPFDFSRRGSFWLLQLVGGIPILNEFLQCSGSNFIWHAGTTPILEQKWLRECWGK